MCAGCIHDHVYEYCVKDLEGGVNHLRITDLVNLALTLLFLTLMETRQLQVLQNDPDIVRFVVEGTATGRQLGIGSYGSVEEVFSYDRAGMSSLLKMWYSYCVLLMPTLHDITEYLTRLE